MILKIGNKIPGPRLWVPGAILVLTIAPYSASGNPAENDADGSPGIAPLFNDDSPLSVTIEAPLTTLMNERPEEEYLNGTFSFTGDDGSERTIDLKIRARGNYRRQEEHCDFAPIRLNFRKKQVADTIFAGQDKLKLVTHCQSDIPYYEQLVLREYLAYRFFRVMTTKSFGVRLLRINYVDTEGAEPMTKVGFVIEEHHDVAERNGMRPVDTGDISNTDLDRSQQNLINVFEYMIGNTEYSLFIAEPGKTCCHNSKLMSTTLGAPFTPLPYDFDFAGLVNAPYAEPNPRYDLKNVRQRLYKGLCENNGLLPETFQRFLDKKDTIYSIVDELELISRRSRRDVTRYLNTFFEKILKPKFVESRFINKCTDPQGTSRGGET
ncbi:MAG: hypothetical protein ACR2RD_15670 [Woeseiaceae bacterium]